MIMFSIRPDRPPLAIKEMSVFSKLYLAVAILMLLAIVATGVLVYIGILSLTPLVFLGVAAVPLYGAGFLLAEANILDFRALKNFFSTKFSRKTLPSGEKIVFSPDQQMISEIHKELHAHFNSGQLPDKTDPINLEHVLKQQNLPENRKNFVEHFRTLLNNRKFADDQHYYFIAQEVLKKFDPKHLIKNIESFIPIPKVKIIKNIHEIIVNRLELNAKSPEEVSKLKDQIKDLVTELSREHGGGLAEKDVLKEMYDLIDPHCIIFPRSYLSESLFSAEDLRGIPLEEIKPRDQATEIYLKTLSDIVDTNLTKPLPINESLLNSDQADDFAIDFAQNFRKNVSESYMDEQKYNALAAEVVGKIYKDENNNTKKFMITYDLDDQIFDLLSYKDKIIYMCKRTVKELELTDITEDSTPEQIESQLDITRLRLKIIIRGQMKNSLEYYQSQCMLCDAMYVLYPKFAISFEEKYKNQPDRDHELFPKITNPPKIFGETYDDLKPSKDELAFSVADKIQAKLKLHEKTFEEILKIKDNIVNLMTEFLTPNLDFAQDEEFVKKMMNALDPYCVIFPRENFSKSFFSASDLDKIFNSELRPSFSTKIYLQILSSIIQKNTEISQDKALKYILPINQDLLSNERDRDLFTKVFTDAFLKVTSLLALNEQEYNQLASNLIKRVYLNCGEDIPKFNITYDMKNDIPKAEFNLMDYRSKVISMCKRAVEELRLADIADNFTKKETKLQIDKTMIKLQSIIARQNPDSPSTEFDNLAFFMLQDAMHLIYPRYIEPVGDSFSFIFRRTEECPEIKDPPAIFEKTSVSVTEAEILSNPRLTPASASDTNLKNINNDRKNV